MGVQKQVNHSNQKAQSKRRDQKKSTQKSRDEFEKTAPQPP
jgi:hypothetical protein